MPNVAARQTLLQFAWSEDKKGHAHTYTQRTNESKVQSAILTYLEFCMRFGKELFGILYSF